MDLALSQLNAYLVYIYFAYGLALFSLGFSVTLAPKPKLASLAVTWHYLALLAVTHGATEWAHFFELINPPLPRFVHPALLALSGFLLIDFGTRMLVAVAPKHPQVRWLRLILPVVLLFAIVATNPRLDLPNTMFNIEVGIRGIFYVPGSMLATWAFLQLGRIPQFQSHTLRRYTFGIAVLFGLYCLTYISSVVVSLPLWYQKIDFASAALVLVCFRIFITIGIIQFFISLFQALELQHTAELAETQQLTLTAHQQARTAAEKQSQELAHQVAQAETRYRYLFEHLNDTLLIHDLDGNLLEVNEIACQRLGYSRAELLQMTIREINLRHNGNQADEHIPELSKQVKSAIYEGSHQRKDHTLIPVENNARYIEYNGKPAVLCVARDISERKKTEAEIKRRNQELNTLYWQATERANRIAVSNEIIRTVSSARPLDETFESFAEQTRKLVSFDRISIGLVQPNQNHIVMYAVNQQDDRGPQKGMVRPMANSAFKLVVESKRPFVCSDWRQETRFPASREQTEAMGVLSTIFLPLIWQNQVLGVLNLGRHFANGYTDKDVDSLIPIATQLAVAVKNMQLQETIREAATREEQLRLGREMHDGPGQVLGLIAMQMAKAIELLEQDQRQRARATLKEAYRTAQNAYSEIRESILGLRIAGKVGTELEPALRAYVEHFEHEWNIPIELTIADPTCLHLTPAVGNQVLRIMQEALTNIRQHAEAHHVSIDITRENGTMLLAVKDDGCGFDPRAVQPGHYGVQIMRERAEGIQGRLEITSVSGQGTCLRAWIPTNQSLRVKSETDYSSIS